MSVTTATGRRLGWINMAGLPTATATEALPQQLQRTAVQPPPAPRTAPVMAAANPIVTVTVILSSNLLNPGSWTRYVDQIRKSLDIAGAHRFEAFSCGSDPVRVAIWHAEVRSAALSELRADLDHFAGYLGGEGRITWAPCSPVSL